MQRSRSEFTGWKPATPWKREFWKRALLLLLVSFPLALPTPAAGQATGQATEAEQKFEQRSERLRTVLHRRPRRGTSFDLLYRHYLDAGKLDALESDYRARRATEPEDYAAHLIHGLLLQRQGEFEPALLAYRQAAALRDKDPTAYFYCGQVLTSLQQDQAAITAYREALHREPDRETTVELFKRLGRLHARMGQDDQALRAWSQLAERFPNDPFALQQVAEVLVEAKQWQPALERYRQLAKVTSDNDLRLRCRMKIGQIQSQQGDREAALKTWTQCLNQLKPGSWLADEVHAQIESSFVHNNDLPGLTAFYQRRLEQQPDNLESILRLANLTARSGEMEAALDQFRAAVRLAPTRRDLRQALIDQLLRVERREEAIAQARQLADAAPRDVVAWLQLGELHLLASQHDENSDHLDAALQAWGKLIEIRPDDALLPLQVAQRCHRELSLPLRRPGEPADGPLRAVAKTPLATAAREYYEEAVRRAPQQPRYFEYLGGFLYDLGEDQAALTVWRRMAAAPLDSAANLKRLAELLAEAGYVDAALPELRAALTREDAYSLHELAARLYAEQHQYEAALNESDQMERLADSDILLDRALRWRVDVLTASRQLAARSNDLRNKLAGGPGTTRDYYLAALMAIVQHRLRGALEHLEQGLKQAPDNLLLLRLKATVHRQAGQWDGAADQFRRLAELEPTRRSAHLREVVGLQMQLGRFDDALVAAQKLVRAAPEQASGLQLLASVYFRRRDVPEALNALRRAVRTNPRTLELRLELATQLVKHGELEEAQEHLWRAFETATDLPQRLSVVDALTDHYLARGALAELLARLQSLRSTPDGDYETSLCIARMYNASGDLARALNELGRLSRQRPRDLQLLREQVQLSRELGDFREASRRQLQLVESSGLATDRRVLAQLYDELGARRQADQQWKLWARQVSDRNAVLSVADHEPNASRVELLVTPLVQQDPSDWRPGYCLLRAKLQQGRWSEAAEVAERLLQTGPVTERAAAPPVMLPHYAGYRVPPLIPRMEALEQVRQILRSPNDSLNQFSWRPNDWTDIRLAATLALFEVAREQGTDAAWRKELHRRSESDPGAAQQLCWVLASEQKMQQLPPVLERWLRARPDSVEARVMAISSAESVAADPAWTKSLIAYFRWLLDHAPEYAPVLAAQLMDRCDEEAVRLEDRLKLLHASIDAATNAPQLSYLEYVISDEDDPALLTHYLRHYAVLSTGYFSFSDGDVLDRLVRVARYRQDWTLLLDAFTSLIGVSPPASRQHQYQVGRDFPRAVLTFDDAAIEHLRVLFEALRSAGQLERLRDHVEQQCELEKDDPQTPLTWKLIRVTLHWWSGDRTGSLRELQQLMEQRPEQVELRLLLADAHAAGGNPQEALRTIEDVQTSGPGAQRLEQARLRWAEQVGDLATARQAAVRLAGMQLSSDREVRLSDQLAALGFRELSDQLLQRAAQKSTSQPAELAAVMHVHYTRGDHPQAAALARLLLRQVPRQLQSLQQSHRASALQVLRRTGELETMIAAAQQQARQMPTALRVLEDLSEYHAANGDELQSLELLKRVAQQRPHDSRLQFRLAHELFGNAYFAAALDQLGLIWKQFPETLFLSEAPVESWYVEVDQLDRLSGHLRQLEGHPALSAWGEELLSMMERLAALPRANPQQVRDAYVVVLDILPEAFQAEAAAQFIDFLEQTDQEAAYAQLAAMVLDDLDAAPENVIDQMYPLAELAKSLNKVDSLNRRISRKMQAERSWKYYGLYLQTLLAPGDEALIQLARQLIADPVAVGKLDDLSRELSDWLWESETPAAWDLALALVEVQNVEPDDRMQAWHAAVYSLLEAKQFARADQFVQAATELAASRFDTERDPASYFNEMAAFAGSLRDGGRPLSAIRVLSRSAEYDFRTVGHRQQLEERFVSDFHEAVRHAVASLFEREDGIPVDAFLNDLQDPNADLRSYLVLADPYRQQNTYRGHWSFFSFDVDNTTTREGLPLERQILPALLQAARERDQLDALDEAVQNRLKVSAGSSDTLVAIAHLIAIYRDPNTTSAAAADWQARLKERPELAAASTSWLLAQFALRRTKDRAAGLAIARAALQAATERGRTSRQIAILVELLQTADRASWQATMQTLIEDKRTTPGLLVTLFDLLLERGAGQQALAVLEPAWRRDPDLLLNKLDRMAKAYLANGSVKELMQSLEQVLDQGAGPDQVERLCSVYEFLPATSEMLPLAWKLHQRVESKTGYDATRNLLDYLERFDDEPQVYAIHATLMFDKRPMPAGRFRHVVLPLLASAVRYQQQSALRTKIKEAMTHGGGWLQRGPLMLAMMARRAKDDEPLEQLARQYQQDPLPLKAYEWLLLDEWSACRPGVAREVVAKVYQEKAERTLGSDIQPWLTWADALVALGKSDQANAILLDLWSQPFASNRNRWSSNAVEARLERATAVSAKLTSLKQYPAVLELCDLVRGFNVVSHHSDSRVVGMRGSLLEAGRHLLDGQQDEPQRSKTWATMLQELCQQDRPPRLRGYLACLPPTADSHSLRVRSLLTELLQADDADLRRSAVHEAVQRAQTRWPDDVGVRALGAVSIVTAADANGIRAQLARFEALDLTDEDNEWPVWSVCQAAMQRKAATDDEGCLDTLSELAGHLIQHAQRRGDSTRARTVAWELASLLLRAQRPAAARAALGQLGENVQPDLQIRLARVLFQQQRATEAVDALQSVWEQRPERVLASLESLAYDFAAANRMKELGERIAQLTPEQRSGAQQAIIEAADKAQSQFHLEEAERLVLLFIQQSDPFDRSEFVRRLVDILEQQGRFTAAYDALVMWSLQKMDSSLHLRHAPRIIQLAQELGRLPELQADVRRQAERQPEWSTPAQLFTALIEQAAGREDQLIKMAEQYSAEEKFRKQLQPWSRRFLRALSRCQSPVCLRVAAEHTRPTADDQVYYDMIAAADRNAQLWRNLKQPGEARRSLMSVHRLDLLDSYEHSVFQRLQSHTSLAEALLQHGLPVDSLRVATDCLSYSNHAAVVSYELQNTLDRSRHLAREATCQLLAGSLDDALAALQGDLKEGLQKPKHAFWFSLPRLPWADYERTGLGQSQPNAVPLLLPAVLVQARKLGALDALSEAVEKQRKLWPEDRRLLTLAVLIGTEQTRGLKQGDAVATRLAWVQDVLESRLSAELQTVADEELLLAGAATRCKATRPLALRRFQQCFDRAAATGDIALQTQVRDCLAAFAPGESLAITPQQSQTLDQWHLEQWKLALNDNLWQQALWHGEHLRDSIAAPDLALHKVECLRNLEARGDARWLLKKSLAKYPKHAPLWIAQADQLARQRDWKGAAESLDKGLPQETRTARLHDQNSLTPYLRLAMLHLLLNDEAGYQRERDNILKRTSAQTEPELHHQVGRLGLLSAKVDPDERTITLARAGSRTTAASQDPFRTRGNPFDAIGNWEQGEVTAFGPQLFSRGLAHYRLGELADAERSFEQAAREATDEQQALAVASRFGIALSRRQAGKREGYKQAMQAAELLYARLQKQSPPSAWEDELIARILRREAQ